MNEQLQIRVGLFRVTIGKGHDPINQMVQRCGNDWRSEKEHEHLRFPLADDGQYVHNRMPPQFVFERHWRDYTRRVVVKKRLARMAHRSHPDQGAASSTAKGTS
jgi:uncharacterized protein YifE (UPF0438 family)